MVLARIAEALNLSLHWLVTGQDDPIEVRIAAGHAAFEGATGTYDAPAAERDDHTLQSIAPLYRQACQCSHVAGLASAARRARTVMRQSPTDSRPIF